ncbi:AraC-like DNA-binding protein [Variovorax boronicumulans]|uniref:AraC family transcriptional regulator n=1 Tax=Variovorax boronicumulans TaxID=436515 RepID=UPI002474848C|nr:AraC family transcriptional regulator [Variovorax boronicumulans]MDH6170737.1 AraC-like DNA-binding protein [Variovorax boronicumulans]
MLVSVVNRRDRLQRLFDMAPSFDAGNTFPVRGARMKIGRMRTIDRIGHPSNSRHSTREQHPVATSTKLAGVKGTVSIELVHEALHAALLRNMDISRVLETANLDSGLLQSGRARIPAAAYSRMWVALADLMDDEFFGLDHHGLRRGSYALMTRAAVSAHNLEHALRRILRFLRITLDDFRGELIRTDGEARIVLHDGGVMRRLFGYGTWFILVHGLACWLVHRRIPLREMQFRCPAPVDDSHYRTRFCQNVVFAGASTHIAFDSAFLDLEIVETADTVDGFLREAPGNLLVQYRNESSTHAIVRRRLRNQLPDQWPDLHRLAQDLHMSGTTLQRRLQQEGLNYQRLKDDLRRDIAIDLLSTAPMTVAEVAARTGFQEASAFHRAFKKWTGVSPGAYRMAGPAKS